MTQLTLEPGTTALVVVDLQRGIVGSPTPTVPHAAPDVVTHAVQLADAFRAAKALVVLVRVDTGRNGELFPRPLADVERPRLVFPPGMAEVVPELGPRESDVVVTKYQPGAFYATDLEVHLRRRGIQTIVLCGISTNVGVEATARVGYEHGYNLVFASDAMSARDAELHQVSIGKFFPTIGRVRTTAEIVQAIGGR